jgi:phospholipid transport system substrate-binding protein
MKKLVNPVAMFLILAVFSLLTWPVTAIAASEEEAKTYARTIGDKVLAVLDDQTLSDDLKLEKLEALFVDVVDVKWVGRFVLGPSWRQATPEQQQAYLDAYGAFLVKHYTSNFAEYGGETFVVTRARTERENEFFVRTEIQRTGGQPPVLVDYRLRADQDNGFKVFDIIVEGVSLISTQRSEFASVVNRQGLNKLVDLLKTKTERLGEQMRKDMAANAKDEKRAAN